MPGARGPRGRGRAGHPGPQVAAGERDEGAGDGLVNAYEEAIGHCVYPATVRDKDGYIRFSEMNAPGEPRDQAAWEKALAAQDS